jgi:hypothetical protein
MLKRLDEEMSRWHQTIRDARNAILQLQETRLTLMGLVEDDEATAEQLKMARVNGGDGTHVKPVLILRRNTGGEGPKLVEIEGQSAADAKRAAKREKWRLQSQKKRDRKAAAPAPRADDQKGVQLGSAVEAMRGRVLTLLQANGGGMKRVEIGDRLGLPKGERNRKAMSNAVYSLLKRGKLKQDFSGRFALSK